MYLVVGQTDSSVETPGKRELNKCSVPECTYEICV